MHDRSDLRSITSGTCGSTLADTELVEAHFGTMFAHPRLAEDQLTSTSLTYPASGIGGRCWKSHN